MCTPAEPEGWQPFSPAGPAEEVCDALFGDRRTTKTYDSSNGFCRGGRTNVADARVKLTRSHVTGGGRLDQARLRELE